MTKKRRYCPRGHDAFIGGRDASKRCLQCKAEDASARDALQEQEIAERHVAFAARQAENERRWEREYRQAIKAGGDVAAEARWQRLYDEASDRGWGLCQWASPSGLPGACTRRTRDVYCHVHNRQLERESERTHKAREREEEHVEQQHVERRAARPPRPRRDRRSGPTSNWAAYKAEHPARVAFYASSTWRNMRDRQLRDYPSCVVCGQKASHADHVLAIANGGTTDGRLQSMCAKHQHDKTVRDSHEAGKRRAAQRRNPR